MRTNICQTAAIATTRQGLQVVVRTIHSFLRHLFEILGEGHKRGILLCARLWYRLILAAPVAKPVVVMERVGSMRHLVQRPDRRSCSTPLNDWPGNVSAS